MELGADTEQLIKAAAKKVFLKKGFAGSRLQEIADEAGIGRTALHYYFRSKEKLFQTVWKEIFETIILSDQTLPDENLTAVEKMQRFANHYFDTAFKQPDLDIFLLNEFNNNPVLMKKIIEDKRFENRFNHVLSDLEKDVASGELKGDPKQIFITVISICLFSFAGKAMLEQLFKLDETQYMNLMQKRRVYVLDFLKKAFSN